MIIMIEIIEEFIILQLIQILKKKILAAFFSWSIILSGCSIPNIGLGGDDTESEDQDDKNEDDSEKEDTDQDESDEDASEDESSDDQADASTEVDLADFEANKPVFKMVNK